MSRKRLEQIDRDIAEIELLLSQGDRAVPSADELQIQKYEAAAEAAMEYDPEQAMKWLGQADKLRQSKTTYSPESTRIKLVSNRNSISNMLSNMDANDPNRLNVMRLLESIDLQLSSDAPSIQAAYLLAQSDNMLGKQQTATTPTTTTEQGEYVPTMPEGVIGLAPNTYLDSSGRVIRAGGVSTTQTDWYDEVDEKGATKPVLRYGVEYANLPDNVKERYDEALKAWEYNNEDAVGKRRAIETKKQQEAEAYKRSPEGVAKAIGGGPIGMTKKQFGLFSAGLNNVKQGTYGTAIQNFIKAANPGEAVMADDIVQANKGKITPGLAGILKKYLNYDVTDLTVEEIALALLPTAKSAIEDEISALDTYGMSDEDSRTFIQRYYAGRTVLEYLNNPDAYLKGKQSGGSGGGSSNTQRKVIGHRTINGVVFEYFGGDRSDENNWRRK